MQLMKCVSGSLIKGCVALNKRRFYIEITALSEKVVIMSQITMTNDKNGDSGGDFNNRNKAVSIFLA